MKRESDDRTSGEAPLCGRAPSGKGVSAPAPRSSSHTASGRSSEDSAGGLSTFVGTTWAETAQFRRFLMVGAANTLLDYVLFIALTKILALPLAWIWVAKVISGTVAISISFYLNRTWVFRAAGASLGQGAKFVVTTVAAVYGIQTPLTQLFSSEYPSLGEALYDLLEAGGVVGASAEALTEAFVVKTVAFTIATVPTLTFNFLLYRFWVFRGKGSARSRPPLAARVRLRA